MNVFKRMKRFFTSLIYNDKLYYSLSNAEKKLAEHHDSDEDIAEFRDAVIHYIKSVSYTHLTLPTILRSCRSRWSPYH